MGQCGPAFTGGHFKGFYMGTQVGTAFGGGVWPCGLNNGSLLSGGWTKWSMSDYCMGGRVLKRSVWVDYLVPENSSIGVLSEHLKSLHTKVKNVWRNLREISYYVKEGKKEKKNQCQKMRREEIQNGSKETVETLRE